MPTTVGGAGVLSATLSAVLAAVPVPVPSVPVPVLVLAAVAVVHVEVVAISVFPDLEPLLVLVPSSVLSPRLDSAYPPKALRLYFYL